MFVYLYVDIGHGGKTGPVSLPLPASSRSDYGVSPSFDRKDHPGAQDSSSEDDEDTGTSHWAAGKKSRGQETHLSTTAMHPVHLYTDAMAAGEEHEPMAKMRGYMALAKIVRIYSQGRKGPKRVPASTRIDLFHLSQNDIKSHIAGHPRKTTILRRVAKLRQDQLRSFLSKLRKGDTRNTWTDAERSAMKHASDQELKETFRDNPGLLPTFERLRQRPYGLKSVLLKYLHTGHLSGLDKRILKASSGADKKQLDEVLQQVKDMSHRIMSRSTALFLMRVSRKVRTGDMVFQALKQRAKHKDITELESQQRAEHPAESKEVHEKYVGSLLEEGMIQQIKQDSRSTIMYRLRDILTKYVSDPKNSMYMNKVVQWTHIGKVEIEAMIERLPRHHPIQDRVEVLIDMLLRKMSRPLILHLFKRMNSDIAKANGMKQGM